MTGIRGIGQGRYPVVRHTDLLPFRIVKLRAVRSLVVNGVGFGQVVKILRTATEVFLRVGSISKGKLPPFVQQDVFSHVLCMQGKCYQTDCTDEPFFHIHNYFLDGLLCKKHESATDKQTT